MLQSGASFCRILSVASDAAVRGTGFIPGRSSPGASAVLHSAPVAPIRGITFSYSLCCLYAPVRGTWFTPGRSSPGASAVLHSAPVAPIRVVFFFVFSPLLGCSSPWHPVLPRTIQSGGLGRAPLRPGCSNPGRIFIVFSPLPRMLQSVAPGSPPDDTVQGLVPCFIPPRLLQSGASFYRILSVASDAPVRGTGFPPGRSCPGAWAVLHSAPVAPIRGFSLLYSLRCPGCSNPGRLFVVSSPLPQTLQSVALGSAPDDPVRGLVPCFIPPWLLQSGASFYRILSVALDAPVHGTWFTPRPSSPAASAVLHSAEVAPFLGVFLTYSLRCLGCSSPWHLVHPRTIQSGA